MNFAFKVVGCVVAFLAVVFGFVAVVDFYFEAPRRACIEKATVEVYIDGEQIPAKKATMVHYIPETKRLEISTCND